MNNNINDTIDKALDALIDEAAVIVNEKEGKKTPVPDTDIEFSQEHKEKMQKLFRKERQKRTLRIAVVNARRAACVLLVMAVVMSAAVFSVEAWRIKFLNFIFDADAPDTEINFSNEKKGEIYDGMVELGYIPEGFVLEESAVSDIRVSIYYVYNNKYFQVVVNKIDSNTSIDTEDANVEMIKINRNEGIYSYKENVNILVWHDSILVYRITSNIEKSEIFKIAENVKIK